MLSRRALVAMALHPHPAAAQLWAEGRTIRCVVPFPPGGVVDVVARLVVPALSAELQRTIVIENRGGASGMAGAETVARAAPDGTTLLLTNSTHVVTPHVLPRIPFHAVEDFSAIGLVGGAPVLMAAHPSSPFRTLADVLAAGRVGEGPHFASAGNGSAGHLVMAQIQSLSGTRYSHVPFRGGGPAIQAALGGQVPLILASAASLGPQVANGSLRGIAVSSLQRLPTLPDIPTIAEQGFPDFEVDAWVGLFAPARTPEPVIHRVSEALARILAEPALRERLAATGTTARIMPPARFAAYVAEEYARWGRVVRENGITLD
ncbi:MAG: tripartite tricarboxylate transporter substrate-binding protein [Acetobacteraceae bacterium]|nr:tripartite tricarboxylate transporter substrate-binding protein [Acetobacteraceae bacterium]MDW8398246.1 tripartite tricarboxylate transporter substrate-binding protein [Acetobacteraceae bacterium]